MPVACALTAPGMLILRRKHPYALQRYKESHLGLQGLASRRQPAH